MIQTVWRISQFDNLSGSGGTFSAGRWNRLGTKIVYCSDHPATCMLELLIRFNPRFTPRNYKLLEIRLSENAKTEEVKLPKNWKQKPDVTQTIWERFCERNTAAILKVPSVIMPQAYHYLLNPDHEEHANHEIVGVYDNLLDERFYV